MGTENGYMSLVRVKTLLLIVGATFALVLFAQIVKLRHAKSLLFSISAENVEVERVDKLSSWDSFIYVNSLRNSTYSSGLNAANVNVAHLVSTVTEASNEMVGGASNVKDDSGPENLQDFDDTSDDDPDPEDELPFEPNPRKYVNISAPSTSTMSKEAEDPLTWNRSSNILKGDLSNLVSDSFTSRIPAAKGRFRLPEHMVVPISRMNEMLLSSYKAVKPRWFSGVDQELRKVKSMIENAAAAIEKDSNFDVSVYRNFSAFKRSYELMEKILKVYIYAEGEQPVFHRPRPLKGIYASEGWFMKQLKSSKRFITKDGKKAHLFYLPFSSRELEMALYVPNSHSRKNMVQFLSDYVNMIMAKYSFWNRTGGADHFLVACHDWAPAETRDVMGNCIRSLCNNDIKEGFRFGKDASLPVTNVRTPRDPLRELGGRPPSRRQILAFFAGKMHGYLRPILLNYWKNKDPDMRFFGDLRKAKSEMTYSQYMKSSKYCICAKGYEVHSPRVVEAIFYECVPVIISDNYVPPFFETLNWESFAVFVLEKDIPNLKNILMSISPKRYEIMQQRVKRVQKHFLWHPRPVKYDVFHMTLHSIWHNRVFQT